MNLSFLKWPVILIALVGGIWLMTSGGTNFMYGKFTKGQPGVDAKADAVNEAGLSRLGGYCLRTFQYEKAMNIFQTACQRYPQGSNYYYNRYRMAKCAEKADNNDLAVKLLKSLVAINASALDQRVPNNDVLNARAEKIAAVNEVGGIAEF